MIHKKAIIKTRILPLWTIFVVQLDGRTLKSFYSKEEAIEFRNLINKT